MILIVPQIRRATACCLDTFLACLVHRNEPRFNFARPTIGTREQHQNLTADLELALCIFAILFPADEAATWTIASSPETPTQQHNTTMEPNVCAEFLFQLFEHLVPLLERLAHEDGESPCLLLAGVVLEGLSHQIPSSVLVQGAMDLRRALNDIADLQRDSIIMSSPVWQAMFDPTCCPHPFQGLQSRLQTLQQ